MQSKPFHYSVRLCCDECVMMYPPNARLHTPSAPAAWLQADVPVGERAVSDWFKQAPPSLGSLLSPGATAGTAGAAQAGGACLAAGQEGWAKAGHYFYRSVARMQASAQGVSAILHNLGQPVAGERVPPLSSASERFSCFICVCNAHHASLLLSCPQKILSVATPARHLTCIPAVAMPAEDVVCCYHRPQGPVSSRGQCLSALL